VFFGSIGQLASVGLLLWALLKRLYKRAFGGGDGGGGAGASPSMPAL